MIVKTKRLAIIFLIVLGLLLIPFLAMQLTSQVNWSVFDFLLAGTLLSGTGILLNLVWLRATTTRRRLVLCGLILFGLLVLWAELAVGIFGSPIAGS